MSTLTDATTRETLSLLEDRLRRVDHVIHGTSGSTHDPDHAAETTQSSAISRIRNLERGLEQLSSKSTVVSDILQLHRSQPAIFHADSSTAAPSTLPTSSLAAMVLAHSSLYQVSSANLTLLRDIPLPEPASSTKLVELEPRIQAAETKQLAHIQAVNELSIRSGKALESWYEDGVLNMSEHWADWEERLREIEILVRRNEAVKRRETEGMV